MFLFDNLHMPDFYPNNIDESDNNNNIIDNNNNNRMDVDNNNDNKPEEEVQEENVEQVKLSIEKIENVINDVNTIKIDLDKLIDTKQKLLQRIVVERLGYRFPNELQINLAAGVYRNKIGVYVSQLCQSFEKLDGILSYGNVDVIQNRKKGVKRIDEVLKQADKMFNDAKKLVKFATKLFEAEKYQKKQQPISSPNPATTSIENIDNNNVKKISITENTDNVKNSPPKRQKNINENENPPTTNSSVITNQHQHHHHHHNNNRIQKKSLFKIPKYEILNDDDQVEIRIILPKGCDPDTDLKFKLKDSSILLIDGFDKPLEFAIDPAKMDIRGTTYRTKNGILRVEIPRRMIRPFARYRQQPFSIW